MDEPLAYALLEAALTEPAALEANPALAAWPLAAIEATLQALLSAGLVAGDRERYWLTAAGGARWEAWARPDWLRFVAWGEDEAGMVAEAGDYRLLLAFVASQPYRSQAHVVLGSLSWELIWPWEATYWKTLPQAYRARFSQAAMQTAQGETPPWAAEVWQSLCTWYARPF